MRPFIAEKKTAAKGFAEASAPRSRLTLFLRNQITRRSTSPSSPTWRSAAAFGTKPTCPIIAPADQPLDFPSTCVSRAESFAFCSRIRHWLAPRWKRSGFGPPQRRNSSLDERRRRLPRDRKSISLGDRRPSPTDEPTMAEDTAPTGKFISIGGAREHGHGGLCQRS